MILFFAVNVFSKENPSEIRGFNSPLTDIKITVNDIFDEVAGSSVHYEMMSLTEDGCEIPNLEVETPAPICEGGNTTITVTTDGEEVNWYDDEAAENLIHTGLTFTTPELAETTSYWVQALNYGEGEEGEFTGGGRVAPTGNSGSSVVALTSPWGLSFDTTEDFTINSVDVFLTSSSPGDLVVQLLDENWELIEETTVSCPAGNFSNPVQYELPLDFEVEADNTYRLAAVSGPAMIREFSTEHPGFPYPIGDVGSITGGTINSSDSNDTVYYFFYNWTVTADDVETCESDLEEITVSVNPNPTLEVETPDPICEGESTIITATSDAEEVNWYDDEAAENIIHTGLIFTTPELEETTSYWVQALNYVEGEEEEFTGGARIAPIGNSGSSVVAVTSPWGLSFDTTEDITINSVDVFLTSSSSGDLVVQLLDENWELIEETTVTCPAGSSSNPVQFEVPLDFEVEADNTYRLVTPSGPEMIREFSSEHPGFPYPLADAGSVTGGTINNSNSNNTVYYFFYNWTITAEGIETCESDLEEITVTLNPNPTLEVESPDPICEGESTTITVVSDGEEVNWFDEEAAETPIHTGLTFDTPALEETTTYWVRANTGSCETTAEEVIVIVNPTPDAPIAEDEQYFETGDSLEDLEVEATGDLTWYEDEDGTIVLSGDTELVDETTYYVSQTVEGCESDLIPITVFLQMSVDKNEKVLISVYPNPVSGILNINTKKSIDLIEIYDLTGRKLTTIDKLEENQLDFSSYAVGVYMIQIKVGNSTQFIKVVKR